MIHPEFLEIEDHEECVYDSLSINWAVEEEIHFENETTSQEFKYIFCSPYTVWDDIDWDYTSTTAYPTTSTDYTTTTRTRYRPTTTDYYYPNYILPFHNNNYTFTRLVECLVEYFRTVDNNNFNNKFDKHNPVDFDTVNFRQLR
ncbi:unnamed protein product [Oikopleura dioica]|uniref:Uncharacterized protein n=1 Tax=Oikopleura dioica TaxID=34765 RepID=E4Y6U9_OIKDI|nr:unnamed protein product [Oikopleura dioica]